MIKRNKTVSSLLGFTLLILTGCGQKGPLYLAEEEVQSNQQTVSQEQSQEEQQ